MKSLKTIIIPPKIETIGFFGDLHGSDYNLSLLFNKHPEIEFWFCLGDAIDMFGPIWNNAPTLRKMLLKNVVSIYGNHEAAILNSNDRKKEYSNEPRLLKYLNEMPFSLSIQFGGIIIKAFHATPKSVNEYLDPNLSDSKLIDLFGNQDCDFVIIGHTHSKYIKKINSLQILNPGSLGLEHPSYCIVDKEGNLTLTELL